MRKLALAVCFILATGCAPAPRPLPPPPLAPTVTPETRALNFLAREVPAWPTDNHCYSCHNNGDGARALYVGSAHFRIAPEAVAATTTWLNAPKQWHNNGGDVDYKDEGLARIQFAAALLAAQQAGFITTRTPLLEAADLVAAGQAAEGCWQGQFPGDVGSPVTYGVTLATAQARHILRTVDPARYARQLDRADAWLLAAPVARVIDAAAVLLGLEGMKGAGAAEKRKQCVETIRKGQGSDGGWGPFVNAPAEVFDTALVVLALHDAEAAAIRQRGRDYLIAQQQADGSWTETTRPTGGESYAQRLSTTGWATLALLAIK